MKRLGRKWVPIHRLRLPGSFAARARLPRVAQRAESIKRLGLLHPPWVHTDYRVISGEDRIAACVVAGITEVEVEIVEATDEEARVLRNHENSHRRHDPDEQADLLLEKLAEAEMEAVRRRKEHQPPRPPKGTRPAGRPKTARGEAIAKIAADFGMSEAAVRARARRAVGDIDPDTIETWGIETSPEWQQGVLDLRRQFRKAAANVSQALAALHQVSQAAVPYPGGRYQRLEADLSDLGAALRAAAPDCLCPYCKGIAELQPQCGGCAGCGFVTISQAASVPADLRGPAVLRDGKIVPLDAGDPDELF